MSNLTNYPSISVVIPSFNQGQYIEETIISVIGQQYHNLEILIIDGGSTDNTVEILEKYSSKISYWHSKKDKGQADAINQGINLSSGEVICWLNSDDMYLPGTLLDIGNRFQGKTDKGYLIYGATVNINQSNGQLKASAQSATLFDAFTLTYFDFIVQPSTFWTRELWRCAGELNTSYNYVLDWEWFIRASKFAEFEYVPRFYSVYRYHPLHKTSFGGAERQKEIISVVEKHSSDYWINLYLAVQSNYSTIKLILEFLYKLKVPKKYLWLPFFFPRIMLHAKRKQDFLSVIYMYGLS